MTTLANALIGGGAPNTGIAPGTQSIGNPSAITSMGIPGVSPAGIAGNVMGRGIAGLLGLSPLGMPAAIVGTLASLAAEAAFGGPAPASAPSPSTDPSPDPPGGVEGFGQQTDPGPGPDASGDDASGDGVGGAAGGPGAGPGGGDPGGDGDGFMRGGYVTGGHPMMADDVPINADEGEFVLNAGAVDKIGLANVKKLNSGKFNRKTLAMALMGKG